MEAFSDVLPKVNEALASGRARDAFSTMRSWLEYPGRVSDAEWPVAMEAFARVAREIAGDATGDIALAARDASQVDALYDLGYELIEQELFDLASTVLARAVKLRPDLPGLLSELVAALERDGRHRDACQWLRGSAALLESQYVLRYLLAWNTAMTGDLDAVKQLMPALAEPSTGSEATMLHRLWGVIERARALKGVSALDGDDLRGWHFALHGAVLLRLSPHGFREGMRGRYAFTQDSELRCREGIERLRVVLDAMGVAAPRVFGLPDRDSMILAIATAHVLDVPMQEWDPGATDERGIVVAYDLSKLGPDLLNQLQPHRPGQVLWEHASRWVVDQPVAADVVTYLYQYNVTPWGERQVVDASTGATLRTPADDSKPEFVAARIAAQKVADEDLGDRETLVAFARACASLERTSEHAAAAIREQGLRPRQWTGGPVQSSRFR